jgi:hypothetical protein
LLTVGRRIDAQTLARPMPSRRAMTYPVTTSPENPVLAKLVAAGAANAIPLRGYVGPSTTRGRVSLYPSLDDLSNSVEIASSDILHFEAAPESVLPYGGVIVWLKKDAEITRRRVETVRAVPRADASKFARDAYAFLGALNLRHNRHALSPHPPNKTHAGHRVGVNWD